MLMANKLADELLRTISESYPLRGTISKIDGEVITLNIGERAGVRKGDTFKTTEAPMTLEVTSVSEYSSLAKALERQEALKQGMHVEGLSLIHI